MLKKLISNINPSLFYKQAFIYEKNGFVHNLNIIKDKKDIVVRGQVNTLAHHYDVTIKSQQGEIKEATCTCCNPYCSHIQAVLLKVKHMKISSLPYHEQSSSLDYLNNLRKKKLEQNIQETIDIQSFITQTLLEKSKIEYENQFKIFNQNIEVDLIPVFDLVNQNLQLSYQIGNKKYYILKDINAFLNRIENQVSYSYGKELSFIHTYDAFSSKSQQTISLIKKLNYLYKTSNNQLSSLKRYINIGKDNIDDIYDYYSQEDLNHVSFIDYHKPIDLHITKGNHAYRISINESNMILSPKYTYIVYDEKDIIVERYASSALTHLLKEIIKKDLYVKVEEFDEFYKYVLSPLSHMINMKGIDELINPYHIIQIYGDINEDNEVYFKIYYQDEDHNRISGFNHEFEMDYKQELVEQFFVHHSDHIDYDTHTAYFSIDDEKTYDFINEGLIKLQEYGTIYISDALKNVGKKVHYSVTAGVRISNNLLEINIQSDQIPKEDLSQILQQYRKKKKYYRLKNGELLFLDSPELEELDQLLEEYHVDIKDINKGKVQVSSNRAFQLDEKEFENIQINRDKTFNKFVDRFNAQQSTLELNEHYQDILRDYQKEGVQWLKTLQDYQFNGILADDMGLGKTLQVIALLDSSSLEKPSLVVCPASLIYNWESEVHKFSDKLKVKCLVGNQQERLASLALMNDYHLLITSYDYIRRDIDYYEDKEFSYVILDEAQNIKNKATKNAMSVKKIKADHKIALTGTPIENTLAELWSIFDFLMPDYLYNYNYFRKYFENDVVKNNSEQKTLLLKKMVSPFILRRNKKDVLKELPDKIETTQVIPFNEEEAKIYFASLANANKELQELLNMDTNHSVEILALLTRLRQLCCEPRLVYDNINQASSKLKACMELIDNHIQNNQSILLFSSFTTVLDFIAEQLDIENISYEMLTGSTSKEERKELVDRFQNNEFKVFLISLKAGGTGLNLTNAQVVIHYDPWWNISAQNQATDRAHRIGQVNNVQVHKLVMKDSIEEKILDLQSKKKDLADTFVEGNHGSISTMSKDEIKQLFS